MFSSVSDAELITELLNAAEYNEDEESADKDDMTAIGKDQSLS